MPLAHHGHHQRLGDVEKSVQGHVQHAVPLVFAHRREGRVGMDASVVDQNIDGALRQHRLHRRMGGLPVAQVKHMHLGLAACVADALGQRLSGLRIAVGV